jgi:hypothetical protein
MNPLQWAVLFAVGSFIAYLLLHIIYFRTAHPADRMGSLNRLVWILCPLVAVVYVAASSKISLDTPAVDEGIWPLLLTFIFFSLLHGLTLAFYSAVDHSVRIRLTVELWQQRHKALDLAAIFALYSPEEATRQRITQLESGGYAQINSAQQVILTPKGIAIAKITRMGRKFFGINDHNF